MIFNNDLSLGGVVQSVLSFIFGASVAVTVTILLGIAANIFYNVQLHPLRAYPGPKLWAATRLPWLHASISGDLAFRINALHKLYGPVIRVGPNELSYTTAPAWKAIYGHRPQGAGEMTKDLGGAGLVPSTNRTPGIVTADKETHARMRRVLAYAFSEKALKEQEGFLRGYVDLLVEGLRDCVGEAPQDMVKWFNWTTFDVIGDLAFGESFSSLSTRTTHPWVGALFSSLRIIPYLQVLLHFRIFFLLKYIVPKHLVESRRVANQNTIDKVNKRLAKDEDRKDFLSYVVRASNREEGEESGGVEMSLAEIHTNTSILVIAGSETSATCLSGALYHLLRNPLSYDRLVTEIRSAYTNDAEITLQSVAELKYLAAVLEESLRIYPPAAPSLPRVVPGDGEVIDGAFVPGGTTVGIHQLSTYRSPQNFHSPDSFLPERWLPSALIDPASPFYNDNRACFQPFSYGPRNCIGRSLAYAEMRLILTRLLFAFDFELAADAEETDGRAGWVESQKNFLIWQKTPLLCHLKVRAS